MLVLKIIMIVFTIIGIVAALIELLKAAGTDSNTEALNVLSSSDMFTIKNGLWRTKNNIVLNIVGWVFLIFFYLGTSAVLFENHWCILAILNLIIFVIDVLSSLIPLLFHINSFSGHLMVEAFTKGTKSAIKHALIYSCSFTLVGIVYLVIILIGLFA